MDVVTLAERPELRDRLPFGEGWPRSVFHDPVAARHLPVVDAAFAELKLVVLDDGQIVAGGWALRIRWAGTVADVPSDGSLERVVANLSAGAPANTLVTMAAEVVPSRRGEGRRTLVQIDVENDLGRYVEPNVWVRHRPAASG